MSFRFIPLFLVINFLPPLLLRASPPSRWVEAEGNGRTRETAIKEALRAAVEKGLGIWVKAESLMVNHELQRDIVRTVTKGYVRRYEVLEERREGEGYFVRLRVEVVDIFDGIDRYFSNVPELYRQVGEPRFAVWLHQETTPSLYDEYPAETALIEALQRQGIRVIDIRHRTLEGRLGLRSHPRVGKLKEMGVEVFLYGTVGATRRFTLIGHEYVSTVHAWIDLRAIWVEDGEVLAVRHVDGVTATAPDGKVALRMALQKAAREVVKGHFLPTIVKALALGLDGGRTIDVQVIGSFEDTLHVLERIRHYSHFDRLIGSVHYANKRGQFRVRLTVHDLTDFMEYLKQQVLPPDQNRPRAFLKVLWTTERKVIVRLVW